MDITIPNIWDAFLEFRSWDQVNYVFERIRIPWEEAKFKWPDKIELLQEVQNGERNTARTVGQQSVLHLTSQL